MMDRMAAFFKKDTVLCIALILAAGSILAVPPDSEYLGYVDFRTLAILFGLMTVTAGLQKIGVFDQIAEKLLGHVQTARGIILSLTLLCFFSSMLITNDVALITFVPFTFIVLGMLGAEQRDRLLLPVVVMQTIAANLGSMLTPIGNPQNLYLYGKAGISVPAFLRLMLPYALLSLVLLVAWGLLLGRSCAQPPVFEKDTAQASPRREKGAAALLILYLALFILCLLAVGHILPWQAAFAAVLILVFLTDRQVLAKVDYALLLTFVGFFIFIGNVGRIPAFRAFLQSIIAGREIATAIAASQVISNVPAALLLSGFTEDFAGLIVGTNLGGLGTLIASMASLISYKRIAKEAGDRRGRYIALFTVGNLFFLAALVLLNVLISR
ncbi:SLC13 family permease [uncultured Dysosmobacter sp.]|uniref:SLC13 family permease n=1 Tax=uncultured Dysosmobacter sp. TaxID=2591384 RepID=UPI0034399396